MSKPPVKRRPGRPPSMLVLSTKPGPWIRLYREMVNDPKVIMLPDRLFRQWVLSLCVADHITGALPPIRDYACHLRTTQKDAAETIDAMIDAGLLDADYALPSDPRFIIHGWKNRQRIGDGRDPTNAARQKRFRKRHRTPRNGGVTEINSISNGLVTENVTENHSESVLSNQTTNWSSTTKNGSSECTSCDADTLHSGCGGAVAGSSQEGGLLGRRDRDQDRRAGWDGNEGRGRGDDERGRRGYEGTTGEDTGDEVLS